MSKIRSFFVSLSFLTRLAIFAVITLGLGFVVVGPWQTTLETRIAKEYYGPEYLRLEKAKRRVLEGQSAEKIKFHADELLEWSNEMIAQSWLDSSKATEVDRAKLILGKRAIEQSLPNILQSQVLPETKRNELGILKQAVDILPMEITRQKAKDWEFNAFLWVPVILLAGVLYLSMVVLFLCYPGSKRKDSDTLRALPFLFALFFASLIVFQLNKVIWINALLVHL